MKLTHLDEQGRARMVDVAAKDVTERRAIAEATVAMQPETLAMIAAGEGPKGDVFAVARIAAVQAAKRTGELIPLCHPLGLDHVDVDFQLDRDNGLVHIEATCGVLARTGVEMEAMTAASVAALTIYDMCKAVERGMEVRNVRLLAKSGGRSGTWERESC